MRGKSVFSILSITIVIALLTGCIGGSLPGIVPIASGNATIELAPLKDDWAWSYRPDTNRHDENYMVGVRYKLMNGERAEPVIMFDLSE